MTATTDMRELRSALREKTSFLQEGVQKGVKVEGANVEIKADDLATLRKAWGEVEEIKELIKYGTEHDRMVAEEKAGQEPVGGSSAVGAAAANFGHAGAQYQTLGEAFTKSDVFTEFRKSGGYTMRTPFEVEGVKDITSYAGPYLEQKDVYTGSGPVQQTAGFGRTQFDPMVPRGQRPYRVRDLFSVVQTSANLIDYFRVVGFAENDGDGNAQTVAERRAADETSAPTGATTDVFGKKPKSNLTFESASAPVRLIAHWEAAHRNVLQDEPQLQGTINNELLYGLALEEDDQILNGDGTGENLVGVLRTNGVQDYTQLGGDKKSDALRRAATLSFIANFPGTGFVLHPFDWEDIELQKATGDGQYMLVTNFAVGATTTIWRQPVVETVAIAQKTFLTGAFGLGAQLYDRAVASVRIAEQHADFFVRNAVAILAEERLALAVKRPESFVVGHFL